MRTRALKVEHTVLIYSTCKQIRKIANSGTFCPMKNITKTTKYLENIVNCPFKPAFLVFPSHQGWLQLLSVRLPSVN